MPVPGDFSSAAFWLVAAAALPGSSIEIEGVGLNPTRTALLDVLRRFGARVHVELTSTAGVEPCGTVRVEYDRTGTIEILPAESALLDRRDPAIAALAAHAAPSSSAAPRAARQGKRPHRGARRRLSRARHRRGTSARTASSSAARAAGRIGPAGGVADARGDPPHGDGVRHCGTRRQRTLHHRRRRRRRDLVPGFFETLDRLVA